MFSVRFGEIHTQFDKIRSIPSFVFLIIADDNEAFLVDCGFASDYIPGINSIYLRKPEEELHNALLRHNIYPDKIKTIIQTHLHWDHTGGMNLFPNATFHVQSRELSGIIDVGILEECSFEVHRWLPYLDRFNLIDGHAEIRPGLNVLASGIHTPGHQVVEVKTRSGTVILGGDEPLLYDNLWDMIPEKAKQRYLDEADPKFFWDQEARSIILSKLNAEGKIGMINPQFMSFHNIKKRADKFLSSHDPGLKEISYL